MFDPIKERVRDAMLDLIHSEREGEGVDHRLLKAIVSVWLAGRGWFVECVWFQIFCEMGLSDKSDQQAEAVTPSEITLSCYQVPFSST